MQPDARPVKHAPKREGPGERSRLRTRFPGLLFQASPPAQNKKHGQNDRVFRSSGGRTRTCDLRVMSPTSCHCSTPHRSLPTIPDLAGRVKSRLTSPRRAGSGSRKGFMQALYRKPDTEMLTNSTIVWQSLTELVYNPFNLNKYSPRHFRINSSSCKQYSLQ
jgi:hypothetical protein